MWMMVFRFVFTLVMYMIMAPKPQNQTSSAAGLEDFQRNTADASRCYPICYGTVKAGGANCTWVGDLDYEEIKVKQSSGFGRSKKVGTGQYRYYLGIKLNGGFGKTQLKEIHCDNFLAWKNDGTYVDNFAASISDGDLFASGDINDGMSGNFKWYCGEGNTENAYMSEVILRDIDPAYDIDRIPAWEGQSYLVWEGGYIGNSRNLRQWYLVLSRVFTPPELVDGNNDYSSITLADYPDYPMMNPAYILFDIVTNVKYGAGRNTTADIDIDNFKAAAKQLHEENWGLSIYKDTQQSAREMIEEVCKYANMTMYLNKQINKFQIKLIRADYDTATIPAFNEDNIIGVVSYSNGAVDKKLNEVKIKYTNFDEFSTKVQPFVNPAVRGEKYAVASTIVDYLYLNDPEKAVVVAEREARMTTTDISDIEIDVSYEDAKNLQSGDVISFSFSPYGVYNRIYRIQQVDLGEGGKRAARISAVQDVFGFNSTTFAPPPDNHWNKPDTEPVAMDLKLTEAPLFFGDDYKVLTYGKKPKAAMVNYGLYINGLYDTISTGFTSVLTFVNDYSNSELSKFVVDGTPREIFNYTEDELKEGANMILIETAEGFEFASFSNIAFANGYYELINLNRGCLDTLSKNIKAGDKIHLIWYGSAINESYGLTVGNNFEFQATPKSINKTLPLTDAPIVNYTPTGRKDLPIVPAGLRVNGVLLGDTIPTNTDLQLNWNFRNKANQGVVKSMEVDDEVILESGSEYHLDIYDENDVLLKSEVLTSNNYTFTDETTINPLGEYYNTLKIELKTVSGSLESYDKYQMTLTRA